MESSINSGLFFTGLKILTPFLIKFSIKMPRVSDKMCIFAGFFARIIILNI